MKKIAVLLTICLCSILSCGQPMKTTFAGENNAMDNEQLLLEKENKSLVQEKKHTADDWTVELTSKLEDTRTMTEQYNNVPPKNNIVNSVLFSSKIPRNELKTPKGTPYHPSFEVKKTIKYGSNEIGFTINADGLNIILNKFTHSEIDGYNTYSINYYFN